MRRFPPTRQALALDPAHAEAHNNLGEALFAQGHLNEAAQIFQRGDPAQARCLSPPINNLATIYFLRRRRFACPERRHARVADRRDAALSRPCLSVTCATRPRFLTAMRCANTSCAPCRNRGGVPARSSTPCIALVKCDPRIKRSIDRAAAAWPATIVVRGIVRFRRLARRRQRSDCCAPCCKAPMSTISRWSGF